MEVVIVGDDCALPGTGLAGRRGIAGTIFVHKASHLTYELIKQEPQTWLNWPYSALSAEHVRKFVESCASMQQHTWQTIVSFATKTDRVLCENYYAALQIAGAAAASGLSLAEVRNVAQEAAVSIGSMGVATQICKIPGEKPPRGYVNLHTEE